MSKKYKHRLLRVESFSEKWTLDAKRFGGILTSLFHLFIPANECMREMYDKCQCLKSHGLVMGYSGAKREIWYLSPNLTPEPAGLPPSDARFFSHFFLSPPSALHPSLSQRRRSDDACFHSVYPPQHINVAKECEPLL